MPNDKKQSTQTSHNDSRSVSETNSRNSYQTRGAMPELEIKIPMPKLQTQSTGSATDKK